MTEENNTTYDPLGLKTKRESLGLTLRDVFLNTRISVVNLEAIEKGNFRELPVPIYTRNFIKTYAGALDMDSKPILDSYEAYLNSQKIEQTEQTENEPKKESNLEKIALYKTYIWTAAIIIVIIAVVFFISQQYQPASEIAGSQPKIITAAPSAAVNTAGNPMPAPTADQAKTAAAPASIETNKQTQSAVPAQTKLPEQKNVVAAQPTPELKATKVGKKVSAPAQAQTKTSEQKSVVAVKPVPKQKATKIEKPQPAAMNEDVSLLEINATEETWLRIKTDQNPPFQILLKPGEKIEREGTNFDVDIGNAGGIRMQFKGKTIENLGKSGQVIHLRLP